MLFRIQTGTNLTKGSLNMNNRQILFLLLVSMFLVCHGPFGQAVASTEDHAIWAELLNKYIKPGGVDYTGLKSEEEKLDQYLKILEDTDLKSLSHEEQFAYYINAYNAWTIKLILSAYPGIKSIKDLGTLWESPWKKKFIHINGELLSLDDIEHHILRPRFKNPRVHFAINCSAVSCPPLRSEPYLSSSLDRQLEEASCSFVNDPNSYRLEGDTFYVSQIFKWYTEDFNNDVLGFYLKYAKGDLKKELTEKKDVIRIKYLRYDWSLNDIKK